MLIRPAVAGDASALHAFTCALALDHAPAADVHAAAVADTLAEVNSVVLVAEDGEMLGYALGYAHGSVVPMPLYGGGAAFLQELYVDPARRRAGVGRALVERFVDWGRERGAVRAVVATSRAGDFYEQLGFVTRPTAFYQRTID